MKLVNKVLHHHLSRAQLAGFFLANLAGMLIVLLSIQLWFDLRPFFSGEDRLIRRDFLVVTKKVSTLGMLTGRSVSFTSGEIREMESQPFIRRVGRFIPSQYDVTAGIQLKKFGVGFTTEMFFESVPDVYVDTDTRDWKFNEQEGIVPIILPRNYLNLYNFGFAQSRGLPKLSEGALEMLELDIEVEGNGGRKQLKGKIAGFSDRLNTILVPEQFMDWANRRFSNGQKAEVSRLIVEAVNPADAQLARFFKSKGYEIEDGKLAAGKLMWLLNILTFVVAGIGLLVCVLAFYILVLSIYLLVQKNTDKIGNLFLLGYSLREVMRPYLYLTLAINGSVWILASGLTAIIRCFYRPLLKELNPVDPASGLWPLLAAGLVLYGIVSLCNFLIIRHKLSRL